MMANFYCIQFHLHVKHVPLNTEELCSQMRLLVTTCHLLCIVRNIDVRVVCQQNLAKFNVNLILLTKHQQM